VGRHRRCVCVKKEPHPNLPEDGEGTNGDQT
jgi:hypothetical protein